MIHTLREKCPNTELILKIALFSLIIRLYTTAQRHSIKPDFRFCADLFPARCVSEIRDGEDIWRWSCLEIRLKAFHWSITSSSSSSSSSSFSSSSIYQKTPTNSSWRVSDINFWPNRNMVTESCWFFLVLFIFPVNVWEKLEIY